MRAGAGAIGLALHLAACGGQVQSALAPTGGNAVAAFTLLVWMSVAGVLILALVCVLTFFAFWRGGEREPGWLGDRRLVVAGGIVFPLVTLSALLVWEVAVLASLNRPPGEDALRIEVTGHQYWWRMRYLLPDGAGFETANQVVLPAGEQVELILLAEDVIHSFWIPSLAGKMDMIPGRENRLAFDTGPPAVLRGQCAEFCGEQHALMAFDVEVLAADEFAPWLDRERGPALEPPTPEAAAGREAFLGSGCGECHTVRGTPASGRSGPDLTHVGSRRTIAAGSFPNNTGTLAGWIADAQHLKPGNRMPSFEGLDGVTLRAIAVYLASLR